MHWQSYLRSAEQIIHLYTGDVPFAVWLKSYFRQYKKFGSKDRRIVGDLCFCFYRLGKAFETHSTEDQLLIAQFLCHGQSVFVEEIKPAWKEHSSAPAQEKISFLLHAGKTSFFPSLIEVSNEVNKEAFDLSHLIQPDLFLRLRPDKSNRVRQKLSAASFLFFIEGDCIRLPNNSKIDDIIELDKEAVVQDKSSQQVLNSFKTLWEKDSFTAWDCCAASGGKSILLHDHFPNASLTVSDIRESILHNLRSRFKRAGITSYQSFVADVSSPTFSLNKKFDVIICDAPCSGSGTWGRTPEQLRFFQHEKIEHYARLQKAIAVNASRHLKQSGAFIYITCSVFKKENEDVVEHLLQHTNLQLQGQEYLKGYNEKADTLFAALFSL